MLVLHGAHDCGCIIVRITCELLLVPRNPRGQPSRFFRLAARFCGGSSRLGNERCYF